MFCGLRGERKTGIIEGGSRYSSQTGSNARRKGGNCRNHFRTSRTISWPIDDDMPNNPYALYASGFGVKIVRAEERIKAVTLNADSAKRLGAAKGTAALQIDRVARDLENRLIEWRVSICLTEQVHYRSDLR